MTWQSKHWCSFPFQSDTNYCICRKMTYRPIGTCAKQINTGQNNKQTKKLSGVSKSVLIIICSVSLCIRFVLDILANISFLKFFLWNLTAMLTCVSSTVSASYGTTVQDDFHPKYIVNSSYVISYHNLYIIIIIIITTNV